MSLILDGTNGITTPAEDVTGTGVWSVGGTQLYKDANGNLGIGTNTLNQKLNVNGGVSAFGYASSNPPIITSSTNLTQSIAGTFIELAGNSSYTVTLPDPTLTGNMEFRIWLNSPNPITLATPTGNFYGTSGAGTTTVTITQSTSFYWYVASDGYNWVLFAIPSFDASGNLLVGTTSVNGKITINNATNQAGYGFYVDGANTTVSQFQNTSANDILSIHGNYNSSTPGLQYVMPIRMGTSSSLVGSILWTGSAIQYNTSSDPRLKNITGLITPTMATNFVMGLQPKYGTWKSDGSVFQGFVTTDYSSVDPQSVQGQPNAVDSNGNPIYQQMEYGSPAWCANMTAFVQNLQNTITNLEAKLKAAGVAGF